MLLLYYILSYLNGNFGTVKYFYFWSLGFKFIRYFMYICRARMQCFFILQLRWLFPFPLLLSVLQLLLLLLL